MVIYLPMSSRDDTLFFTKDAKTTINNAILRPPLSEGHQGIGERAGHHCDEQSKTQSFFFPVFF